LDTIWRTPDELWQLVETILEREYPRHPHDRRRADLRCVLDGIIYKLRTGCQWNALPKEFGDDSTVHRHFQAWCEKGILQKIWAELAEACALAGQVDFEWQSADGSLGKARGVPKKKRKKKASGQTRPTGPKQG